MSIFITLDYKTVESNYNVFIAKSNLNPSVKEPKPVVKFFGDKMGVPFYRGLQNSPYYFSENDQATTQWNISFPNITLRPEQEKVVKESLELIEMQRCCIISCPPGFGKTFTTLFMMYELKKGSVLIVTNRCILLKQWQKAIQEIYPSATMHVLKTKDDVSKINCDFILTSIQTLKKFNTPIDVDVLICDELHSLLSYEQTLALLLVRPQKLIGLSATPYRYDDLNTVIEWMFGPTTIGTLFEPRPHTVFKINTGIRYPIQKCSRGKKEM